MWILNGQRHRDDGPAVEWFSIGYKLPYRAWYIDGLLHRENGPVIERSNGVNSWYLKGKFIDKYDGKWE